MRHDMSKVITERPRWGHQMTNRKSGGRIAVRDADDEYEDQPKHLPISWGSQGGMGDKCFSDLLGPLRRYLRRNVGRPWDKVFSELKGHLDTRSVTGRHVFDHIETEVRQDCFIGEDGQIYTPFTRKTSIPVYGLYVHPRTRLLRWKEGNYWKDRRKAEKEKAARERINNPRGYIKVDGIWYFGYFTQWTTGTGYGTLTPPPPGSYEKDGKWMAPVRKKQCSKAELKAARLTNDGDKYFDQT